jgi:hypothetical protein
VTFIECIARTAKYESNIDDAKTVKVMTKLTPSEVWGITRTEVVQRKVENNFLSIQLSPQSH